MGSFIFPRTASSWFRKFVNFNAEAQRTLRTAEDLYIMHENEISEKIIGAAIALNLLQLASYFRSRSFGISL